jgi:hypothetical protein
MDKDTKKLKQMLEEAGRFAQKLQIGRARKPISVVTTFDGGREPRLVDKALRLQQGDVAFVFRLRPEKTTAVSSAAKPSRPRKGKKVAKKTLPKGKPGK